MSNNETFAALWFKSSSQKMKQWGAKIIGFISREWTSEGSWNFVQGIAWDMNFSWYLDRSSSKTYFPWSISPSLQTTNQSYLCNDVLTKKMVSQVWMVNTILELLLPFEHQHINNLQYTCSWSTHPWTYKQHLDINLLMLMIMMFIKSEDTNEFLWEFILPWYWKLWSALEIL